MMKKCAFLLVCAAVFLCAAGCQKTLHGQETVRQGNNVPSESDTWDFKSVQEGKKYTHSFILNNMSDKSLKIKDVSTSCGCTGYVVKKKSLAPGEMTEISVTFDSTGYEGEVTQFIYVRTDSLDKPIVRFIIKAFVVR